MDKSFTSLISIISSVAIVMGAACYAYINYYDNKCKKCKVNELSLFPDQTKVVNSLDIEDLGESDAFCRCWRSKSFPFCDGAHNDHNKLTNDNVGPLVINKTKKA